MAHEEYLFKGDVDKLLEKERALSDQLAAALERMSIVLHDLEADGVILLPEHDKDWAGATSALALHQKARGK